MNGDLLIKTYDLDGIIRQAVKKYSRFFIAKKLRLSYEPVNTQVLTDEKWLEFVLEQLISNAVKYTKEGGTIRIWMDGPQTLAISDTGIGIRREDLPRVLREALPVLTAAVRSGPPGWDCICAAVFWDGSPTGCTSIPRPDRETPCVSVWIWWI